MGTPESSPGHAALPLPIATPALRPASFPSPTTRPEPYKLTPVASVPTLTRGRPIPHSLSELSPNSSPPRASGSIPFPTSSPPALPSPLSQPPYLAPPSSPSLSLAADPRSPSPHFSPAAFSPRNIVILLDGTGKQFSRRNSNVIKTLSVLEADETQLVYYSSGVGTILPDHASTWGRIRTAVAEAADTALAWNFDDFVCSAYKYLMDFYRAGDKVYIFGFSRGAYTARALAGMIQKVGLLAPGNHNQIKLAYEVYLRPDQVAFREGMTGGEELSVVYRQIFGISRTVRIEFLGLWDTVSSLGGIYLPRLPYAGNVKSVRFFRHALALDERRVRFVPEYRHLEADENDCDPYSCHSALTTALAAQDTLHSGSATHTEKLDARRTLEDLLDQKYPEIGRASVVHEKHVGERRMETKYLRKNVECWFMGCHSDVGGGNTLNGEPSLSNIPFRWMLREAVHCGLKLEAAGICLQPAIYMHPAIAASGLIPDELIQILKEELRGETVEFETETRVRSIVDQFLPHSRLVEIIELATKHDAGGTTAPTTAAEDAKAEAAEGKAEDGQCSSTEPRTAKTLAIGPDLLMPGTESLKGVWWILEGLVLQTRKYEGNKDTGRDVWRANLGRPRQMAVGQYIHRSVQQRLLYEEDRHATGLRMRKAQEAAEREERQRAKEATDGTVPQSRWRSTWETSKQRVANIERRILRGRKRQDADMKTESTAGAVEQGEVIGYGDEETLRGPRATLPPEWGTSWRGLMRGDNGLIWAE